MGFKNTASGGGTQFNEDVASANANTGTIALVVRDDALSANAGVDTDGDFTWARVDNFGGLWVAGSVILGTDTYTEATTRGILAGATRNDALVALAGTDNEIAPLQVDAVGALYVNLQGAAYSALADNTSNPTTSLIGACLMEFDGTNWDRIRQAPADDAAFTPGTDRISPVGFMFDDTSPDSVDEGDVGIGRMSANRNQYMTIRDAAGNERGANVDASSNLQIDIAASSATVTVTGDSGGSLTVDNAGLTELAAAINSSELDVNIKTSITQNVAPATATAWGVHNEDDPSADLDPGCLVLARRTAVPADTSGADLDYETLQMDNGRLWVASNSTLDAETTKVIGTIRVASGGIASGSLASGSIASGAVASGAVASGAIAAGALAVDSIALGAIEEGNSSIAEVEDADSAAGDTGVKVFLIRDDALAANMGVGADGDFSFFRANNFGAVWTQPTVNSVGGCKTFTSVDLDESDEEVSGTACTVYSMYCWNLTAAPLWMQMHNETAANADIGTDTPAVNFMIPANADSDGAGLVFPIPVAGLAFSTALAVAITTASGATSGAPGAGDAGCVIMYQN